MSTWFELNFIIILSYLLCSSLRYLFNTNGKFSFENDSFKALGLMAIFPILLNFIPVDIPLPPVIEKNVSLSLFPTVEKVKAIGIQIPQNTFIEQSNGWSLNNYLIFFMFLGVLAWAIQFGKDIFALYNLLNRSVTIKKYGRITLYCSPELKVPCSFWYPNKYIVLFPESVLLNRKMFSHALSHELQHHRQGDTKIIFLMEIFRSLFYLNPFTHLWINRIHENRELKCDKEVLSRKGYKVSEYGNTLIDVVKINSGIVPRGTWAMASLKKMKRRIEMITITKKSKFEWTKRFLSIALTMFVTWQALAVSRNLTGLRSLSLQEAEEMASSIESRIPIEVNDSVLKWLNYFMVDPQGKSYISNSLQRMKSYEQYLTQKLRDHNMPLELLAVPLMESGFSNSHVSSARAAGLWQFIPGTARKYGLEVSEVVDERYNVDKLTGAAIAYYTDLMNIRIFDKDWRLALLAYNVGENRLAKAMRSRGTKDPWAFKDFGDKEYLAKIMAGIIILKSPSNKFLSSLSL